MKNMVKYQKTPKKFSSQKKYLKMVKNIFTLIFGLERGGPVLTFIRPCCQFAVRYALTLSKKKKESNSPQNSLTNVAQREITFFFIIFTLIFFVVVKLSKTCTLVVDAYLDQFLHTTHLYLKNKFQKTNRTSVDTGRRVRFFFQYLICCPIRLLIFLFFKSKNISQRSRAWQAACSTALGNQDGGNERKFLKITTDGRTTTKSDTILRCDSRNCCFLLQKYILCLLPFCLEILAESMITIRMFHRAFP